MVGILAIMLTISLLIIVILAVVTVFIIGFEQEHHVKNVWNKFIIAITWKPKTGIDKEIAKEKKKIQAEEKEIESIRELVKLIVKRKKIERRREELFEEVEGYSE